MKTYDLKVKHAVFFVEASPLCLPEESTELVKIHYHGVASKRAKFPILKMRNFITSFCKSNLKHKSVMGNFRDTINDWATTHISLCKIVSICLLVVSLILIIGGGVLAGLNAGSWDMKHESFNQNSDRQG
ncbi:hypothetical protein ACTXT7_011331 [Hymenolepis weldensis]